MLVAHIVGAALAKVFENRVLRKIFWPKRFEIIGEKIGLYTEELYNLYSSPNIIRMIKSGRTRLGGHVALLGRRDVHTEFWCGNLREGDHLEDKGIVGRIILKYIFKQWDRGMNWIDVTHSRDRW
jgi:hypothetical protein